MKIGIIGAGNIGAAWQTSSNPVTLAVYKKTGGSGIVDLAM